MPVNYNSCLLIAAAQIPYLNITFSLMTYSIENKFPNNRFIRIKKKAPSL